MLSLYSPPQKKITNHTYPCTIYTHSKTDVLDATLFFRNILFKIYTSDQYLSTQLLLPNYLNVLLLLLFWPAYTYV